MRYKGTSACASSPSEAKLRCSVCLDSGPAIWRVECACRPTQARASSLGFRTTRDQRPQRLARGANLMIKQHGVDGEVNAGRTAARLISGGDIGFNGRAYDPGRRKDPLSRNLPSFKMCFTKKRGSQQPQYTTSRHSTSCNCADFDRLSAAGAMNDRSNHCDQHHSHDHVAEKVKHHDRGDRLDQQHGRSSHTRCARG